MLKSVGSRASRNASDAEDASQLVALSIDRSARMGHGLPSPKFFESSILNVAPSPHSHPPLRSVTMLQRTLLRASRQAARPLSRPQAAFAPPRQPLTCTRAAPAQAPRWYSDSPATKEGEAASASESKPAEASETSKLKEEIEKKDKEIIDLKVGVVPGGWLPPPSTCPMQFES